MEIYIGVIGGIVLGVLIPKVSTWTKRKISERKERKEKKVSIDIDLNNLTPRAKANLVKMIRTEVRRYLEELQK